MRSLSENSFRQSDDEEENNENEWGDQGNREENDEETDENYGGPKLTNGLTKDAEDRLLKEKRELVVKLEQQNKEILKEIKKLKLKQLSNKSLDLIDSQSQINSLLHQQKSHQIMKPNQNHLSLRYQQQKQQQLNSKVCYQTPQSATLTRKHMPATNNLTAMSKYSSSRLSSQLVAAELQTLKQRKGQLESRMHLLESSRDELIGRLTQLDSMLLRPNQQQQQQQQPVTTITSTTCSPLPPNTTTTTTISNNSPRSHQSQPTVSAHSPPLINITTTSSSSSSYIPVLSASVAMQMPAQPGTTTTTTTTCNPNQQQQQQQARAPRSSSCQPSQLQQQEAELHPSFLTNGIDFNNNNNAKLTNSLLSLANTTSIYGDEFDMFNHPVQSNLLSNSQSCAGSSNNLRNLRNDLLIAADSVTNAMQSLVKELNSDNEIYKLANANDDYLDPAQSQFDPQDLMLDFKSPPHTNSTKNNNSHQKGKLLSGSSNRFIASHSLSASSTPITYRRSIFNGSTANHNNNNNNNKRNVGGHFIYLMMLFSFVFADKT